MYDSIKIRTIKTTIHNIDSVPEMVTVVEAALPPTPPTETMHSEVPTTETMHSEVQERIEEITKIANMRHGSYDSEEQEDYK